MKKLTTFRLDPELLEKVRRSAHAENRTVTNFVETVLRRSVEAEVGRHGAEPPASGRPTQSDQSKHG